jgi:hypothetical protein
MGPSYSFSFDSDGNPIISNSASEPPEQDYMPPNSDIRFSYQYDSYSNWIERIATGADGFSGTTRREITYY